ncbi:MAG: hypothetical protein FJ270_08185 [Planctomycetes bacterium]|nr:hypothetical protein [Planctomycetota bacterium]
MTAHALAVMALAVACSAQQDGPPVQAVPVDGSPQRAVPGPTASPTGDGASPDGVPAVATSEDIGRILDAAEAAGARLESMACTVIIEKRDALTDDVERRRGRLVLQGSAGPARRIALRIDQFIDGSGRASEDRRLFLYRDGWLIERDDARKQQIERQLVAEGTSMDPLQPGEGPLALPVGARRSDVLANYTVTAASLPESPLWKDLPASDVLCLVPRPSTPAARDSKQLIVAWDRATALPIAVVRDSTEGDRTIARLRAVEVGALNEADRALVEVQAAPEGWTVDRRPLAP